MFEGLDKLDLPDNELWQQLRAGNPTALGSLATRWYRPLVHYGTKLTADHALIQDTVQDLFLTVWEHRQSLPAVDSVRAYLFVSLRNNLLRRIKHDGAHTSLTDADGAGLGLTDPESLYVQAEETELTHNRLHQLLERLPKRQREALYLRYYENLSHEEIATVMGLNRQVIANYLQHALHNLRHNWHDVSYLLFLITFHL